MAKTSVLEAVKIQARAIVPVVKALEAELGKARAHEIVGNAIAESWGEFLAGRTAERNTHPASGEGLDYPVESEVIEHTEHAYAVNMTSCAFADYFRKIGEPEIGALLTCGIDFAAERRLRPDWEFERTQTRMQGAPYCDFRWRLRAAASPSRDD